MLTPEQRAEFVAKLEASAAKSDEVETQGQEQEAGTPSTSGATPQGDTTADRTPAVVGDSTGTPRPPVPYDRFSRVNAERKEAVQRAANLEARIKELEGAKSAPKAEKSFLEQLVDEERQQSGQGQQEESNPYEGRLQQLERLHASTILDQTIAAAQRDHPDLPEDILLAAIGNRQTVEDAVEIWENMKAKVLKATGAVPAQQQASRVPTAKPPIPRQVPPQAIPKPQTMDEAHLAFRRLMAGSK